MTDICRADTDLFVYGSLMEPGLRRRLIGREVIAERAYLRDFERRHGLYFYVVPKAGATVEGQVLRALSPKELCSLDHYENVPRLYTRQQLTIHGIDNRARLAWIYLPTRLLLDHNKTTQA
jgi:gamma-glutamylcyclotransferase (GGCT)/AIG2-like uncharacterized protein YtfP